jgi:hypothetical protein
LVLRIPTVIEAAVLAVHRDRHLAIITERGLLTATTGKFDL